MSTKKLATRVIEIAAFEVSIGYGGREGDVAIELQMTPAGAMTEFYIPASSVRSFVQESTIIGKNVTRRGPEDARFQLRSGAGVLTVLVLRDQEVLQEVVTQYAFSPVMWSQLLAALLVCVE
jgi:hypothetical protein